MPEFTKMGEMDTKTIPLKCCSKFAWRSVLRPLVLFLLLGLASGCKFPRYLESQNTPWNTIYKEEETFQGYFQGAYLRASKCDRDNNCAEYTRKCIAKISDEKFEVQHQVKGNDNQYLCMQFIRRSSSIIQIKESIMLYYRNSGACNDESLALDNWPLITVNRFFEQKVQCPFSGGYNIRLHTSDSVPTCPKELISPRLESECEPGDGITINFRDKKCMDENLHMSIEQSFHCAATWTHGQYTFVILRPQKDEFDLKAWCLRITGTDDLSKIDHAFLFMDFVCDPGDSSGHIRETTNFLYLEFEQRIVNSICANLSPICDEKRLCDHEIGRNCPKTCKFCKNDLNPCTFPAQFQGHWVQYEDERKKYVNISYYELSMSESGRFQCHEQDDHDFENNTMLLQTFDNGCFPRFACLEINKPSSSTLEYRLGNRISWPLNNWGNLKSTVCDEKNFKPNSKDMLRFGKHIEAKPTTILIDNEHHFPAFCGLDKKWFRDSQLYIKEKDHCDLCLVYDGVKHPKRIVQVPLNCSKDEHNHVRKHFKCISDTLVEDDTTQAILTRTLHTREEYLCWVFVEKDDVSDEYGVIHILESSFCDNVAIEAVKNGYLEPITTYSIPKITSTRSCPYIGDLISTSTTQATYLTPRGGGPYNPQFSTIKPISEMSIDSGSGARRHLLSSLCLVLIIIGQCIWFS